MWLYYLLRALLYGDAMQNTSLNVCGIYLKYFCGVEKKIDILTEYMFPTFYRIFQTIIFLVSQNKDLLQFLSKNEIFIH